MYQPLDTNPNANYEIFIILFQLAKNKHLPMKSVRYQKRKHKKSKWMTTGILNSINTKDGLYKTLLKTDTNTGDYQVAKANFKRYREILRNSIKRENCCIIREHLTFIKMMLKKLGHLSKRHYNRKRNKSFPQSLSGMIGLSLILTRLLINLIHIS